MQLKPAARKIMREQTNAEFSFQVK